MATQTPIDQNRKAHPAEWPPEETFWQTYSANLEFPIATVVSILIHAGLVVLFLGVLYFALQSGGDQSPVPITLVDMGGFEDQGSGSPGSGDNADPLKLGEMAPNAQDYEALPLPTDLPTVKDEIQKQIALENPLATIPLSDEKAAELALLDKSIRDKLLGVGQKRGSGGSSGSGDSGQAGTGPGGFGADTTRARGLRWVIRFRTADGRNYLDQLRSMGAIIIVPVPPDFKTRMHIYRDLKNPTPGVVMTSEDWDSLSNQIRFCDFKQESGKQISEALGLPFTAPFFWAFFPKGLENELARMETSYQNRRAEDIEETVFQAVQRGGSYELQVARQTVKR
ncbi:MAG: hypothetical protein LC104_17295 [Bacteroidales bacterium]|nr:hypothetical protein [Bacteroidales bacterium]